MTVVIVATVDKGWHIYASTPGDSPYSTTAIEIEVVDGITVVGELMRPKAAEYPLEKGTSIYEGSARFEQAIQVESQDIKSIDINVSFQVCNDQRCLRPTTKTLNVIIPK